MEDRPPGGNPNAPQVFFYPEMDAKFLQLLERMSSRFDFDRDEAMEMANAELHAMREERDRFLMKPLAAPLTRPTEIWGDSPPTSP